MTDLLETIRRQLRTRLDDLRPLVREYERLEEAEKALSDGSDTRAGRTRRSRRGGSRAPSGASRRGGSRGRTGSAAERDADRQKVLALVRQRPGITKAELKEAVGLSGAGVAQNLRRLLDRGDVREEALPGGVAGYRLGSNGDSTPGGSEVTPAAEAEPAAAGRARAGKPKGGRGKRASSRRNNAEAAAGPEGDAERQDREPTEHATTEAATHKQSSKS